MQSTPETLEENIEIFGFRKIWKTPELSLVGKISKLVLLGGGKLSPPDEDPGEPYKVPPTG